MRDFSCVSLFGENGEKRNRKEIKIGNLTIGKDLIVIAGPCSVESEEQIIETAVAVKKAGAVILRGGAYKPRTSPYTFQGLGKKGIEYLCRARDITGMPIITEAIDTRDVETVAEYADIIQIGARNMQNYSLLAEVGKLQKPVLLKRGLSATYEEWLLSAEHIMSHGNENVILCERGIRTFDNYTRNTLDLTSVRAMREMTRLPVFVDPSHATGRSELVTPMAVSAVVAGCDGLFVEVHPTPAKALSDAEQQLTPLQFEKLMIDVKAAAEFRKTLSYS